MPFCLRLADTNLEQGAWIESLGSLIAANPPSRWKNQDEHAFAERLNYLAAKFLRTEAAAFPALGRNPSGQRMLVTLTLPGGTEKAEAIHISERELGRAERIKKQIYPSLSENSSADIYALLQLVWDLLGKKSDND